MTNQIRISEKFEFTRANVIRKQVPQQSYTIDTTSELAPIAEQIVGTTHELIAVGDVSGTAFCRIEVLHATAVVSVGYLVSSTFTELFSLKRGDPPAIMPRVGALGSVYLRSTVASTPVGVTLVQIVAPA